MPRTLSIDPVRPQPGYVEEAATELAAGNLVVVPTETVYGLAADPRVAGAVERIYVAKGRPDDKPLALFVTGLDQVRAFGAEVTTTAEALAAQCWPGPLTLVLPGPGERWLGFRIPDHPVPLAIVRRMQTALAVTSANRSGDPPALTAALAARALGDAVALILDAGPSPGGVPSTVVRVHGRRIEVIRHGALSENDIRRAAAAPRRPGA